MFQTHYILPKRIRILSCAHAQQCVCVSVSISYVNWDQICLSCVFHPAAILYELLYDRVFKVDQGLLGLRQRVTRPTEALSDDSMAFCCSSEESDLDTSEALW